ncbi:hypothetical protein SAMN06298216_4219 [Spirosomataceae bacterium TFI 002]|nr:hypothetical protein SAMN06298216_4219 [Spirosomataceae bacterium TFI 002]
MRNLSFILYFLVFISCKESDIKPNFKISTIIEKDQRFENDISTSTYEYDNSGLLKKQTISFPFYIGNPDVKITPLYINGQLTKLFLEGNPNVYYWGEEPYKILSEITYDSKNRMIKNSSYDGRVVETFEYTGKDEKPFKYSYNITSKYSTYISNSELKWENNNLIELTTYDKNEVYSVTTYKYDNSFNFLKLISEQYYQYGINSVAFNLSMNNLIESKTTYTNIYKDDDLETRQFWYNSDGLPLKFLIKDIDNSDFAGFEIEYFKN